jgi:hypothetical protein
MTYGFSILSGSGASNLTVDSSSNAPGIFIDTFLIPYNSTVSRTYSNFSGSKLFAYITTTNPARISSSTIVINNISKTVSVTSPASANIREQVDLRAMIFGK